MLCRESWVLLHVPQKLYSALFSAVLTSSKERYSMDGLALCAVATNRHPVLCVEQGWSDPKPFILLLFFLIPDCSLKAGHDKASLSLALLKSIRWLRHAFDLPASYLMTWRSFITNFSLIRPQTLLCSSAHAAMKPVHTVNKEVPDK